MNTLLRLEELAEFLVASFLFFQLDCPGWWYAALILAPDLGMIGYLASPRVGAATYNLLHHKGIGVALAAAGWFLESTPPMMAGLIVVAHAALDRTLGYGLKYDDDFAHTHLGWLKPRRS